MARKRGFFRGALDALIAARAQEANRHLDRALLMLNDEELKAHGYDRSELKRRMVYYY